VIGRVFETQDRKKERDPHFEQDSTSEKTHFFSPHVLAAASVAGKPDRESQKRSGQSCGIKTGQAAHLSHPDGAVGELGGDTSSPSSACIAF